MLRVKDKVAVVTGAARGLGAAIAAKLIAEGAKVVLTDILDKEGEATAKQLGDNAFFIHHDVTDEANWNAVIAATEAKFGAVDVLINNAGILGVPAPINEADTQVFRQVMEVNIVSVFLGMKTVLVSMKKTGAGSIVNISSVAGLIGPPHSAAYAASKFAVRGITKTAAHDYGQYKIRVNSVHPGFMETDMTRTFLPEDAMEKETFKTSVALLGRAGLPDEVANMVLFLGSDESSYSTGSEFVIDGGYLG